MCFRFLQRLRKGKDREVCMHIKHSITAVFFVILLAVICYIGFSSNCYNICSSNYFLVKSDTFFTLLSRENFIYCDFNAVLRNKLAMNKYSFRV